MHPPTPPPTTIPELFAATVQLRGDAPALGSIAAGELTWRTWQDLAVEVAAWASFLTQEAGVGPGDRVAQISPNCAEWVIADLAIQSLGAVHVPLHAALTAEQAAAQIAHSESRVAIARDAATADRLRPHLPSELKLFTHANLQSFSPRAMAAGPTPSAPTQRVPTPNDLATILYTSGTTGEPLGVMLTQRNLVSNAIGITNAVGSTGSEIRLGILPLSHIYARTCDLSSWLVHGGRFAIAESRETVFRDCQLVKPTAINAVPYFYQKVVDRVRAEACHPEDRRGVRPKAHQPDSSADLGVTEPDALRNELGGAVRRCFCGGAALPPETDQFFADRDLPILCGYGLTEASPVITATSPGDYRLGTVGRPLPDVEIRLSGDGEILTRGPHVMRGYWRNDAATARVLQDDWLATGDLGEIDAAGHLRIAGRKKELIVLATGKNVAPAGIEGRLNGSPWIEQSCVFGDGRKCLAALIVPNGEMLRGEIKRRRLWVWSRRRALTHPQVLKLYREEITRCLADLAQFEQIAAFTLIGRTFSLEHGEVTPKLSLRRKVIEDRFAKEIEAMYRRCGENRSVPRPLEGRG
jgi:long-chain acyl-CoA synthetase